MPMKFRLSRPSGRHTCVDTRQHQSAVTGYGASVGRQCLIAGVFFAAFGSSACGIREPDVGAESIRTKNLTIVTSRPNMTPTTLSLSLPESSDIEKCSPDGAIYPSNPVEVLPPEENSAEQSFSNGECSFYGQYKRVMRVGRYRFVWSTATTTKPPVVQVSRDGIFWQSLATRWSPNKPSEASAVISEVGDLRVRIVPGP